MVHVRVQGDVRKQLVPALLESNPLLYPTLQVSRIGALHIKADSLKLLVCNEVGVVNAKVLRIGAVVVPVCLGGCKAGTTVDFAVLLDHLCRGGQAGQQSQRWYH